MLTVTAKWGALECAIVQASGFAVIGTFDDPCALDLGSGRAIPTHLDAIEEMLQSRFPCFFVKAGRV